MAKYRVTLEDGKTVEVTTDDLSLPNLPPSPKPYALGRPSSALETFDNALRDTSKTAHMTPTPEMVKRLPKDMIQAGVASLPFGLPGAGAIPSVLKTLGSFEGSRAMGNIMDGESVMKPRSTGENVLEAMGLGGAVGLGRLASVAKNSLSEKTKEVLQKILGNTPKPSEVPAQTTTGINQFLGPQTELAPLNDTRQVFHLDPKELIGGTVSGGKAAGWINDPKVQQSLQNYSEMFKSGKEPLPITVTTDGVDFHIKPGQGLSRSAAAAFNNKPVPAIVENAHQMTPQQTGIVKPLGTVDELRKQGRLYGMGPGEDPSVVNPNQAGVLKSLKDQTDKLTAAQQKPVQDLKDLKAATQEKVSQAKQDIADQISVANTAARQNKENLSNLVLRNTAIKRELADLEPEVARQLESSGPIGSVKALQQRVAAMKHELAGNSDQITAIRTGHPQAGANSDLQTAQATKDSARIELAQQQAALQPIKDQLTTLQKHVATNPAVDPFIRQLSYSHDPMEVMDKIAQASSSDVAKLAQSSLFSGPALKSIEGATRLKFLQMAYDPETGLLSHVKDAKAAFNRDKLATLFGGGSNGLQEADRYTNMYDALAQAMEKAPVGNSKLKNLSLAGGATSILTASLLLHHPYAAIGEGAGMLGAKLWTVLEKAVADKRVYNQFHEFLMNDPSTATVKNFPLVAAFFRKPDDNTKDKK